VSIKISKSWNCYNRKGWNYLKILHLCQITINKISWKIVMRKGDKVIECAPRITLPESFRNLAKYGLWNWCDYPLIALSFFFRKRDYDSLFFFPTYVLPSIIFPPLPKRVNPLFIVVEEPMGIKLGEGDLILFWLSFKLSWWTGALINLIRHRNLVYSKFCLT